MITDNELIIRVKSGETDKLGLLYERHKEAVFAYFFKLTGGDLQLSEDLVHTVFLRILKYSRSYRGDGKFVLWLFTIARNVGLDHHRKKKHHEAIDHFEHQLSNDENLVDEIIKTEQHHLLSKALSSLKMEEREVLILGKLKELSYTEVGEIINCKENYVKVKIHRALKSLKMAYLKLEKSGL